MKLTTLLDSALIVASVALIPRIAGAQPATNNYIGSTGVIIGATSNGQINTVSSNSTNVSYLKPFNLVSLAYQGGLEQQGIPSGGTLIFKHQNRNITAKDLVKAAVNANKLPTQVLNDQNYLSAVRVHMASLSRNFSY